MIAGYDNVCARSMRTFQNPVVVRIIFNDGESYLRFHPRSPSKQSWQAAVEFLYFPAELVGENPPDLLFNL